MMNTKQGKNHINNILLKISMLVVLVASLVTASVILMVNQKTSAADIEEDPAATIQINSSTDLVNYANEYAAGRHNRNDTLKISITGTTTVLTNEFISIGTSSRPFSGTVNAPSGGVNTFNLANCPLFDYISTDCVINGTIVIAREKASDNPATGVKTNGALFANHVVKGSNDASWQISLIPYSGDSSAATSFDCLIKDIEAGSNVNINFTNTAALEVQGAGNVGLICGTLGAGASLAVTTAGSGSGLTVRSTSGSGSTGYAGSLVGYMGNNATLTFNSNNNSRVTNIISNANYAGGVVGYAENPNFVNGSGVTDYNVSGTVSGYAGAGGIVGNYVNTKEEIEFSLYHTFNIANNMSLSATRDSTDKNYVGGVFGCLSNAGRFTFDGNNANSEVVNVTLSGYYTGGLFGWYDASTIMSSLEIKNADTSVSAVSTQSAGIIGSLRRSGVVNGNPAYINIHDVNVNARSNLSAGLIGEFGDAGSFLDVSGSIIVSSSNDDAKFNAGIINNMPSGVLRLQGTTDLSACQYLSGSDCGQIVNSRGNALIYALGNGESLTSDSNWKFIRYVSSNYVDDVRGWGEVLRVDGTTLKEKDLFVVDVPSEIIGTNYYRLATEGEAGTKYTISDGVATQDANGTYVKIDSSKVNKVTVKAISVSSRSVSIANVTDFALVALNMQLNSGDKGALTFENTNNKTDDLSTYTINITSDINLANTGLTGFQKDNGTNTSFSGSVVGNNHYIEMATGEVYGLYKNGNVENKCSEAADGSDAKKQGYIIKHTSVGLFANTSGTSTSISNLTVKGYYNIYQNVGGLVFGGLVARTTQELQLSNITLTYTLNTKFGGGYSGFYGSLIGRATGNELDIVITSSTITPTLNDSTTLSTATRYFGGVVAFLEGATLNPTQNFSIDGSTIKFVYDGFASSSKTLFGGIIAYIQNNNYTKNSRTIRIGSTSENTLIIDAKAKVSGGVFGGILGTEWKAVDAYISNFKVDCKIKGTGSANYGGLLQVASGYMQLNDITFINSNDENDTANAKFNLGGSTFGFIANKGYTYGESLTFGETTYTFSNALYVEVNDALYDIGTIKFVDDNGTVLTNVFTGYDELVYDTRVNGNSITANGNAIISITSTNTKYENKTAYGKISGKDVNANSRYYYNLASAITNASSGNKYDLLVYTVSLYAHSSIKPWFTYSTKTFTGSLDMSGLSYYPVNFNDGTVSFNNAIIILDEISMNTACKASTDSLNNRTTQSSSSQHYLMHTGLFMNFVGTLNMSNVTLQGNVPYLSNGIVGFVVNGQFGGNDTSVSKLNINGLVLDGCYISNGGNHIKTETYAPLIINTIQTNSNISIIGVKQYTISGNNHTSAYNNYYTDDSNDTNDYYAATSLIGNVGSNTARSIYLSFGNMVLDSRKTPSNEGDMNAKYGTFRSIFSRATFLESFAYDKMSSGSYLFGYDKDWDGNSQIHEVTYGIEISLANYDNNSGKYAYTETDQYVSPNDVSIAYSFSSTYYLPYVYTRGQQLIINKTLDNNIEGCGTKDEPYVIKEISDLVAFSKNINNGADIIIYLPIVNNSTIAAHNTSSSGYTKSQFKVIEGSYTNGTKEFDSDAIREYLSSAYYSINTDITIATSDDFKSLGDNGTYPFKGVILGNNNTIVNLTDKPLIYSSTGAVIKNLNLQVGNSDTKVTITLKSSNGSLKNSYVDGLDTYGALIAQVMGGDNFIDHVSVTFANAEFAFSNSLGTLSRLNPIGGYVGTLLNGGLIFRNMTDDNDDVISEGLTSSTTTMVADNSGYLYVNPYIGRVIAGYSFYETTAFKATEEDATLKNGKKNYSISDLDSTDTSCLSIAYVSSEFTITVSSGQGWYMLGAIVNSGAGSASYHASNEQNYNAIDSSYVFWQAYRSDCAVRGTDESGDVDDATTNKVPYIIRKYTTDNNNNVQFARAITQKNVNIVVDHDCVIPAGFKGINSIYSGTSYIKYLRLSVKSLNGNSNKLTLNMFFNEYGFFNASGTRVVKAYVAADKSLAGFGLFNYLVSSNRSETNSIHDLVLAGSASYDVYTIEGNKSTYPYSAYSGNDAFDKGLKKPTINTINDPLNLGVGGISGYLYNPCYLKDITFDGLEVEGACDAGGLIGFVRLENTNEASYKVYIAYTKSSEGTVSAIGGFTAGGLIGRVYKSFISITGDTTNKSTIKIGEIQLKSASADEPVGGNNGLLYGANTMMGIGGLIGSMYSRDGSYKLTVKDICVSDGTINIAHDNVTYRNRAGGFFGNLQGGNKGIFTIDISSSRLENVNIYANASGGIIGEITQKYELKITDCVVYSDNNSTISGTRFAGGLVGLSNYRDNFITKINSVTVEGYNIVSAYTDTANSGSPVIACAAGGLFGVVKGDANGSGSVDSSDTNRPTEINDIRIKNCNIQTNYNSGSSKLVGTGGIVGLAAGGNATYNINTWGGPETTEQIMFGGYNILLENNIIKHLSGGTTDDLSTNKTIGEIVGNNLAKASVRLVGVSIDFGNNNEFTYVECSSDHANKAITLGDVHYRLAGDNETGTNYNISAISDSNGKFIKLDNSTGATVTIKVGENEFEYYRLAEEVEVGAYSIVATRNFCNKICGYANNNDNQFGKASTASGFGEGAVIFADYSGTYDNETVGNVGATITLGTDYYRPYDENIDSSKSRYNITATVNNSGTYYKLPDANGATVVLGTDYYRPWRSTDNGNKYKISVAVSNSGSYIKLTEQTRSPYKSPYVTINPLTNIVNMNITGDGIVEGGVSDLPISDILSENPVSQNASIYDYAANSTYTDSTGQVINGGANKSIVENAIFSTFATEIAGSGVNYPTESDFPVLVVDSDNTVNRIINAYIRMLTNSTYDYSTDIEPIFTISIYKAEYVNGNFVFNTRGASLKRDAEKERFYLSFTDFDSGKAQFSLIDVQFYKTQDYKVNKSNKQYDTVDVVYHLYIPVYVKKVLSFEFDVAAQSGTSYLQSTYENEYGSPLIENIGTPVTLYFKYKFKRNIAEWNEAINGGEDLLRNFTKTLIFHKANKSENLKEFSPDTVLSLVDPNTGQTYYGLLGNGNGSYIKLNSSSGATVTIKVGENEFEYYRLAQDGDEGTRYIISAVASNDGAYVSCSFGDNPTITLGNNYYRLATGNDNTQKYSFEVITGEGVLESDGETIDLSKFRKSTNGLAIDGDYFEPIYLCDLLNLTVIENNDGLYIPCNEDEATICADFNNIRTYFRLYVEGEDEVPDHRYNITASQFAFDVNTDDVDMYSTSIEKDENNSSYVSYNSLAEAYYISIFTHTNEDYDKFHYYLVYAPSSFNESGYLAKMDNTVGNSLHLVMGKIFEHSGFAIDSFTNRESSLITMEGGNNAINVNMSAEFGLNNNLDQININTLKEMFGSGSVSIYQSFLVYLNKNDGVTSMNVILGNPSLSGHYYTLEETDGYMLTLDTSISQSKTYYTRSGEGSQESPYVYTVVSDPDVTKLTSYYERVVTYAECSANTDGAIQVGNKYYCLATGNEETLYRIVSVTYLGDNMNLTQSFAEYISNDLHSYFATGNNFVITALATLTYDADSIGAQFPGKNPNDDEIGVTVSGSSKLAFSMSGTSYSKNSTSGSDSTHAVYNSEELPESAILDLNPYGNKDRDFSDLGINALNSSTASSGSFKLVSVLDTTQVRDKIVGYDNMIVMITLSQKNDSGTYVSIADVSTYIKSATIGSASFNWYVECNEEDSGAMHYDGKYYRLAGENDTGNKYLIAILNQNVLDDDGAYISMPNIDVTIITGTAFEHSNQYYSNYKLFVNVMLRSNLTEIASSKANNFIVYTNAKVSPDYIDR